MPHKITELGRDERIVWGTKFLFVGNHLRTLATAIQSRPTPHGVDRDGHDFGGAAGLPHLADSFDRKSYGHRLRLVDYSFDLSDAAHPSETVYPSDSRGPGLRAIWWVPT